MANSSESDRFEFGSFCLDRRRRLLTAPGGEPACITAKAFDTLVYFLEHPGQVIDRSTLMEALWPDTVVEENNLSQAVAALRRVLGDGFIVTVPRRGYQFVAEVRTIDEQIESRTDARGISAQPLDAGEPIPGGDAGATPGNGTSESTPRRVDAPRGILRNRTAYGLIAALVLAGGFVVAHYAPNSSFPGAVNPSTAGGPAPNPSAVSLDPQSGPKIAVLPCENLSPNPDDAYFAAGIHEEILNQITKLSGLRVVARTSVLQYQENRPSIQQIARDLDVTAVLECSVRFAGTGILVTAQLIDPQSDEHLWSNTYPGDLGNLDEVFEMQADIAIKIATAMNAELSPDEERRLEALPTESPEAYVEYLRHLERKNSRDLSHLDRAIEIDPNFGFAYALRGLEHVGRALTSIVSPRSRYDFDQEIRWADSDARRALAIDPDLALAHVISGARYLGSTKPDEVRIMEAGIKRAVALSPNDVRILSLAAGCYLAELRPEDARGLLVRITQLNPDEQARPREPQSRVGEFLFLAGDLDRAAEYERRFMEREPTSMKRRHMVAFHEVLRGNFDEASRQLEIADELVEESSDDNPYRAAFLPIYAYSRLGRPDDARRTFDRYLSKVDKKKLLPMQWVMAYLGIGDVDQAYKWAKIAANRPRVPWPTPNVWLALNPMNDPVLDRPEFLELRRKLGYRNQD